MHRNCVLCGAATDSLACDRCVRGALEVVTRRSVMPRLIEQCQRPDGGITARFTDEYVCNLPLLRAVVNESYRHQPTVRAELHLSDVEVWGEDVLSSVAPLPTALPRSAAIGPGVLTSTYSPPAFEELS